MGSTVTKLWIRSYDFYHTPCEKDVYLDNEPEEIPEEDGGEKDVNTENNNNKNINLVYEDETDEQKDKKSENVWKKEIKKVQEIIEKKQNEEKNETPELLEKSTPIQETQEKQNSPKDDQVEKILEKNVDKIEVEKENSKDSNKMDEDEEKSEENSSDNDDDSKLSSDFEFDNSFDDVEYSGSEDEGTKEEVSDDKRQTYTQIIQPTVNKEEILNFKFNRIKRENDTRPPHEILQEYIDTNQWQEEWNQLSKELLLVDIEECTSAAKMPENKNKSNYSQFFTFDNSRVHLKKKYEKSGKEKIGSDYVNASLILLDDANCRYIAAGAPSEDSIEDFWRMIWEKDCKYVVMLTKLVEGGRMKSAQYWPSPVFFDSDEEDEDLFDFTDDDDFVLSEGVYGSFTVQLKYQNTGEIHPDVTQRNFKILKDVCKYENEEDCESKMVIQFHYSGWPDHGVPLDVEGVCSLVKKIHSFYAGDDNKDKDNNNNNNNNDNKDESKETTNNDEVDDQTENSAVVVHCSAGIGRTGTFLVIHSEFTKYLKAKSQGDVFDIFETVRSLRKQRYYMIQTEEQYLFCYRSLLQLIENN